jgi:hypothetical protein
MAYEADKLLEARHFLGRMRAAEADRDESVFCHELSAFLSASRSVLQYALEEARRHGKQPWYDCAVSGDAAISFLKDQRDLSVHARPVAVMSVESVAPGPSVGSDASSTAKVEFWLDWPGTENAVALCERYWATLSAIVEDGRAHGILPLA